MLRVVRRFPNKKDSWKTQKILELKLYHSVNYHGSNFKARLLPPVRHHGTHEHKSGKGRTVLALGALALAGGATLTYATYDPRFRKNLTSIAPFTDTLIKTLFAEEGSGNVFLDSYNSLKAFILGLLSGGKSRVADNIAEPLEYKAPPPIVPAIEQEAKKQDPSYSEIRVELIEKGNEDPQIAIVGGTKPVVSDKLESESVSLAELEEKIRVSAEEAVNAYNRATFIIKSYNRDIEYIVDEAVNDIKPSTWEKVKKKGKDKQECVRRAEQKAIQATNDINRLQALVASSNLDLPKDTKAMIKNNILKVQADINTAKDELELEQRQGSVTEKYWDKVEKARCHFSDEMESLFPSIDLSKKDLRINSEDLDLFVLHTYATILYYQKELAKMETIVQEKVKQAVESARRGGGEVLNNAQICEAVEQEKRRLTLCFQQQVLKLRKELDDELREQLKRQSQAFHDHLAEAIRARELELERELTRKYDELLEAERCRFKMQLSSVIGRLRGLDVAVKAKTTAEESVKHAQILWSACQALLRAIRAGCPGLPWKDQIRPLDPEITAVQKAAAKEDELVIAVINGIPSEARERGVYPEDALRERFLKVEQVARAVALVPEQGARLPVHILSYLQSLLLIKAASPIPQSELNNEKVDFSKLNTNEILQRARYWLDRGDFAQTLKYMNLLKGAPRCVARQWMYETRVLLETQQAANTLMAHAASTGLAHL